MRVNLRAQVLLLTTATLLTAVTPSLALAATPTPATTPKPSATPTAAPTTALAAAQQFQIKSINQYAQSHKGVLPTVGVTDLSVFEHLVYTVTPGARYNANGSYSFVMNGETATVSSTGTITSGAAPVATPAPIKPATTPTPAKPITTPTKPVVTPTPAKPVTTPTKPGTLPTTPSKPTTPAAPKPKPAAIGVTALQSGQSVKLSWNLQTLGKKNTITSSPTLTGLPTIKSKSGSVTLTGFTPNTTYTFTLTTTLPARKYVATTTFLATPPPVENPHFFRSAAKITLLWDSYSRSQATPTPTPSTSATPTPTPTQSIFSPPTAQKITLTNLAGGAPESFTPSLSSSLLIIPDHLNSNSYSATFTYSNAAGNSEPVTIQIPATTPSTPTALTATVASKSSVTLNWAYSGPSLTGQIVTVLGTSSSLRSGATIPLSGSVTTTLIDGLTPGATYSFQIVAKNNDGQSPATSSNSVLVATAPTTPTGLKAQPKDGSVVLLWNAADNGGSPVTTYKIESRVGAADTWTLVAAVTPAPLVQSTTLNNLTDGTTYSYRISATNTIGSSQPSASIDVTPAAVPGPVTSLQAFAQDSSISLSWVAPLKTGGSPITGYNITYTLASGASQTNNIAGAVTTATVGGLVNGTNYTITVAAVNAIGASVGVVVTGKPVAAATTPTALAAHPLAKSLTISWAAPASLGGQLLTSYTLQYRVGSTGAWLTPAVVPVGSPTPGLSAALTTATSAALIGLTNGTPYQVQVAAVTGPTPTLTGAFSAPVTATPVAISSAPQALSATKGNLAMNLTWIAPADLGGLPVTGYLVQYKSSVSTVWVTAAASNPTTAFTVPSLLAGTIYNFQVSAINTVGTSVPSATVTATASSLPNAPSALTATAAATAGVINLSWSEPAISSPSPTTGYLVQYKLDTATTWSTATPSILALSYQITGLTSGALYDVAVSTLNEVGASLPRTATATTN